MNEQQVRGSLGLSMVSGSAVCGEGPCLKQLRSGACKLVLVDCGASENTREMYRNACAYRQTPMAILPEGLLSKAVGRDCMAVACKSGGLTDKLLMLLQSEIQIPAGNGENRLTDRNVGGASVE